MFGPLALGFISSFAGGSLKHGGASVPARPPPWVFGVVWTILYMLLGVAWSFNISYWNDSSLENVNLWAVYGMNLTGHDMFIMSMCFYSLLMFCLFLWPFMYNYVKNPKAALYVLLMAQVFAFCLLGVNPRVCIICVAPLIAWLGFAAMIEFAETNHKLKHHIHIHSHDRKYLR